MVATYSWTERTAAEPSPTAVATRLLEPLRTSPAAKMPGIDVSKGSGARAANASVRDDAAGKRPVGEDEALVVELERALEPRRGGVGADEAEEPGALDGAAFAGRGVLDGHGLEVVTAGERAHLGGDEERDPWVGVDALDEVVRHAVREIGARGWRSTRRLPCCAR